MYLKNPPGAWIKQRICRNTQFVGLLPEQVLERENLPRRPISLNAQKRVQSLQL